MFPLPDQKFLCTKGGKRIIYSQLSSNELEPWADLLAVSLRRLNQRGVSLLMAYGADLDGLLASWLRTLWQVGIRFVHLLTTPSSAIKTALQKTGFCAVALFSPSLLPDR